MVSSTEIEVKAFNIFVDHKKFTVFNSTFSQVKEQRQCTP